MTIGDRVTIRLDGETLDVPVGVPLGAVLHGLRDATLRRTAKSGAPRGVFCGLGTCFDCLVTIDGRAGQRACLALTRAGMQVETEGPPR
jgi:hypothetical protein